MNFPSSRKRHLLIPVRVCLSALKKIYRIMELPQAKCEEYCILSCDDNYSSTHQLTNEVSIVLYLQYNTSTSFRSDPSAVWRRAAASPMPDLDELRYFQEATQGNFTPDHVEATRRRGSGRWFS